jgi:hypothetical protein
LIALIDSTFSKRFGGFGLGAGSPAAYEAYAAGNPARHGMVVSVAIVMGFGAGSPAAYEAYAAGNPGASRYGHERDDRQGFGAQAGGV